MLQLHINISQRIKDFTYIHTDDSGYLIHKSKGKTTVYQCVGCTEADEAYIKLKPLPDTNPNIFEHNYLKDNVKEAIMHLMYNDPYDKSLVTTVSGKLAWDNLKDDGSNLIIDN
jgi:hypothetical protein